MKKIFFLILVVVIAGLEETATAQSSLSASESRSTFVIVHGAWGGSWAFRRVDSMLTARGAVVYRPSLTGQGERVHLASPAIGLKTHIHDVINTILYEDLHDVVLVGHSYGGMVITGVADSISSRIKKMIYLDAMLPVNGESVSQIMNRGGNMNRNIKDGFIVPAWVREGQLPPKDVPQSLKTFTDPIELKNQAAINIPSTYILTVAKGTDAAKDDFASQAERARKRGWYVIPFEADHNPQWSALNELVEMLYRLR